MKFACVCELYEKQINLFVPQVDILGVKETKFVRAEKRRLNRREKNV